MNIRNYFNKLTATTFVLIVFASFSIAQTAKSTVPRQEKLLNNLKILLWQDTGNNKVTVKLRIHSGAAFDTLNKEGTMALLADALFPNESVREYFRDDLGGSLDVESNYDYLQISATGDADKVLTILETIATAVTKPSLDKETTAKVRTARLEKVKGLEKDPAYIADLAVAKRLFGNYPYGRSAEGTTESLAKIDFADLILAKQRFLTADNATIAVSGNIKYDYILKAIRQLYGGWEKAGKKVPATFAEPIAPDTVPLTIESLDGENNQLRLAFRGAARNDKNFWIRSILARILEKRMDGTSVRQNTDLLPAMFVMRVSAQNMNIGDPKLSGVRAIFNAWITPPITQTEITEAKSFLAAERQQESVDEKWLNADTFKIISVEADAFAAGSVTLAEVQKMSENLRQAPMATVIALRKGNMNSPLLK